jgi:hypothetical protein
MSVEISFSPAVIGCVSFSHRMTIRPTPLQDLFTKGPETLWISASKWHTGQYKDFVIFATKNYHLACDFLLPSSHRLIILRTVATKWSPGQKLQAFAAILNVDSFKRLNELLLSEDCLPVACLTFHVLLLYYPLATCTSSIKSKLFMNGNWLVLSHVTGFSLIEVDYIL